MTTRTTQSVADSVQALCDVTFLVGARHAVPAAPRHSRVPCGLPRLLVAFSFVDDFFNRQTEKLRFAVSHSKQRTHNFPIANPTRCLDFAVASRPRNVAPVFRPEGCGEGLVSKAANYIECRLCPQGISNRGSAIRIRSKPLAMNHLKVSNRLKVGVSQTRSNQLRQSGDWPSEEDPTAKAESQRDAGAAKAKTKTGHGRLAFPGVELLAARRRFGNAGRASGSGGRCW
jgi:hypothetical protein